MRIHFQVVLKLKIQPTSHSFPCSLTTVTRLEAKQSSVQLSFYNTITGGMCLLGVLMSVLPLHFSFIFLCTAKPHQGVNFLFKTFCEQHIYGCYIIVKCFCYCRGYGQTQIQIWYLQCMQHIITEKFVEGDSQQPFHLKIFTLDFLKERLLHPQD